MDLGVTVQPTTGALLPGADRTTAEGPRCARGGAWPEGPSSPGAKCRPRFPAGKVGALLTITNVKLPACKAGVAIPMQNVAEIRAWRLADALRVARDLPGPARCRSPPRGPAGCTVAASSPGGRGSQRGHVEGTLTVWEGVKCRDPVLTRCPEAWGGFVQVEARLPRGRACGPRCGACTAPRCGC